MRDDAPLAFRKTAALASFRDLIAIATITHVRALELRQRRGHRVLFGEAFEIYPWMLDRDYDDMIGHTPAILGTHEVGSFRGQSSPALFRTLLGESVAVARNQRVPYRGGMRIFFFGRLADRFGRMVEHDASEARTIGDLRRWLGLTDPAIRACIGDMFVGDELMLSETIEIEFWPPVSGG